MGQILRAQALRKSFGGPVARVEVLRNVQLEFGRGELVAVAGSSGSGKSTLLHILGGLMHPDGGHVELLGQELYALSDRRRAAVRNGRVGFVFQFHHLLAEFTALENVMMPALIAGRSKSEARRVALGLLETMGLEPRAHHKPGELSGGEQQRVAVARALVNDPDIVLADEPSGNLDEATAQALHDLLERLARDRQLALLVATHSPALARRAQRILVLRGGVLEASDTVEGWV